jgi:hypothetical protein
MKKKYKGKSNNLEHSQWNQQTSQKASLLSQTAKNPLHPT